MRKRLVLSLLGLFMGGLGSTLAQTPASRIVLVAPMELTPKRTAFSLQSENPWKPTPRFGARLTRAYERDFSVKDFSSSVYSVKTLVLTQSSVPLMQLLGGRLQLNIFQSTFHTQTLLLNPFDNCGIQRSFLRRQTYPRSLCSVDLSGVSLSFHFGRDARTEHPVQEWRRFVRIAGGVLN
jgi:hypothetical protein